MAGYIQPDVVVKALRSVPLFADASDVSDADLSALSRHVTLVTRKRQGRIFEEGASADACYVLIDGRAKVVISGERGSEIILNILEPHCLVGELSLLDGSPRSAALVAIEESTFLRIPSDAFTNLQRKNAALQARLLAHVASTLRHSNEQLRAICSFQAVGRVAWCLGRLAARDGRVDGAAIVLTRPAHHEIAEMTGCSRETVTRALRRLKTKRCITWDERQLRIEVDTLRRYLRGTITFNLATTNTPTIE
jgi:CRP-like cAMP-binding protein